MDKKKDKKRETKDENNQDIDPFFTNLWKIKLM